MKVKVLSLLQPWATLLFLPADNSQIKRAAKAWETRSWKPSKEMRQYLKSNWLYIHASLGWKKDQRDLLAQRPFYKYLLNVDLPRGAIIGRVRIGEILTTEMWKQKYLPEPGVKTVENLNEYHFGDYTGGRYAWNIIAFELLAIPIPATGSLSFWDYDMPNPYGLNIGNGHASFTEPPNVQTAKAVQTMMELAFTMK
jgi:hypothetical protein